MDRTWMEADRRSQRFSIGFEQFLKFASENARDPSNIPCPCLKCCNNKFGSIQFIKNHVYFHGIMPSYNNWRWHGESSKAASNVKGGTDMECEGSETVEMNERVETDLEDDRDVESNEFLRFVEDGDKPLYPSCTKSTKMNAILQTFSLKAKHSLTDSCYTDMLILFHTLLPDGNEMPQSALVAKKTLSALGMKYQKIDACPNDCILYRESNADAKNCPSCNLSRWKLAKDKTEREGVPAKTLWYFPPIPRFRRMFQSPVSSKDLIWHSRNRKNDGFLRHPADSPTWKTIDTKWPEFGIEPRNLRLGLASDGFNPFGNMSSKYSCWPVILVIYNLPPWLCMKRKYMMLTLLISGPKQPGNDIDVYLQPLIDDLQVMWRDGIERVYDSFRGEYFNMKVVLLWTINDFPAYGNLSGSIVKGYNACPICLDQTKPYRLAHSKKMSFMRTRRWTTRHHPYRKQAASFDNTVESDDAPHPLTGEEVFSRVASLPKASGKGAKPATYKGPVENRPCWKKRSIFFDLEYWRCLPVRHNLDVMHIEKNCCEAILGTLLNIPGKTKDGVAARLDMIDLGIRADLKPAAGEKRDKLPMSGCNLFAEEKKVLCNSFFSMKGPSRFSSNIQSLVSLSDLRLGNLKSHDCHVIMQLLLPVAIRSVLEKPARYAIIRFCLFFKAICSKVVDVGKLKQLQADLVDTVCVLEKHFPPSFFDIMVHLTLHLVREVELSGPVFFRWMYPFERFMKVFKGMVHNRTYPEGSIAECYIVEEAVEFIHERMSNTENVRTVGLPTVSIRGLVDGCKRLSSPHIVTPSINQLSMAHLCVLQNSEEVLPYFDEHMEYLELKYPNNANNPKYLKDKQMKEFPEWFKNRVLNSINITEVGVSETIRWLAGGPKHQVPTYRGYHVNGSDYSIMERDAKKTVQNSGVFLVADAMQLSSAKDKRPTTSDMNFYGRIKDIWEVDYVKFRVPIFFCDWVESSRGVKVDELGFTLVKLGRLGHQNDPFVLATHVKQVFYIDDPLDVEWSVVIRCSDRDYRGDGDDCDDQEDNPDDYFDNENYIVPAMPPIDSVDEPNSYARPGDEGIWIDK